MRTVLCLLVLLVSLLAGCTGNGEDLSPDETETGSQDGSVDPSGQEAKGKGDETDPTTETSDAPVSHEIHLNDLDYEASLNRFELVAESDLELTMGWEVAVGSWSSHEDCAALAVQIPAQSGAGVNNQSVSVVTWSFQNNIFLNQVTVDGEENTLGMDMTGNMTGGTGVQGNGTTTAVVPAGHRVIVEMGGRTGALAQGEHQPAESPSQTQDNVFSVNLTYKGEARFDPLPGAPLRCGTSTSQAEDATLGVHGFSEVLLDAEIRMETQDASTMFLIPNPTGAFALANNYRGVFHDQTHETPDRLVLSTDQGGPMAIEIDTWVAPVTGSLAWFMADTHWPWVHAGPDQAA